MLIGIEGNVGSGKTLLLVKYLRQDSLNNRNVFSNIRLTGISFKDFDIDDFLNNRNNDQLFKATIGIDEITMYMDCRCGSSKQNLLMGYLVLQSRKRGIDIYYTTQDLDLVDYKRLVRFTNIVVYCQEMYVKNPDGKIESLENWRNYTIVDLRKHNNNVTQFNMDISPYYKYYDTNEIVEPLIRWSKEKK